MLLVAHRIPRTPEGCAELAAAGATMFEADVQERHGTVVVSHYLPQRPLRGLVQRDNARLRFREGPPYDPTLDEVLERVPTSCGILLDPKGKDARRRRELIEALTRELMHRPDRDRFTVSTGGRDELDVYRRAGFRTWRTIKTPAELAIALDGEHLPDEGVSVRHTLVRPGVVERLHRVVDTAVTWTVNDVRRARAVAALGVDGITTDSRNVMSAVAAHSL